MYKQKMPGIRATSRLACVLALAFCTFLSAAASADALNITVSPSNAVIDVGQTISITASVNASYHNVTYQWYNDTNASSVPIPGANAFAYNVVGTSIAALRYHVEAYASANTAGNYTTANASSAEVTITVDPPLNVITDYYPTVLNLTSGHTFTFNALYNTQVSGGTGNYIYTWNTAGLYPNAFIVNASCAINTPFCSITAANVSSSISGTLTVSISDTSAGNASYASPEYYFITANPDPPLPADYLDRNLSGIDAYKQRIGLITPAAGQIVYSLGIGNEVVAATDAVLEVLPSFGINVSPDVMNIGLNYDYYLPDYFEELVNSTANYVPVDAGAFEGTLSAGLRDFQEGNISAVVVGGDFDKNISDVESDVMLVANTTGTTGQGEEVVSGMNGIAGSAQERVAGTNPVSVAMVIWYGYGSMYVDGSKSFVGSEISAANANNIFSGFYPSPSAESIISGNPDYIIASIFGTPYDNISTTYEALSTIPGIQNTSAWREGHVYVLGNLATNITDEPGPLAAYGTLLYAMILHPESFGLNQSQVPNNVTGNWVKQNVMPSLDFLPSVQIEKQGGNTVTLGQPVSYVAAIQKGYGPFVANLVLNGNVVATNTTGSRTAVLSYVPQGTGQLVFNVVVTDTGVKPVPYSFSSAYSAVNVVQQRPQPFAGASADGKAASALQSNASVPAPSAANNATPLETVIPVNVTVKPYAPPPQNTSAAPPPAYASSAPSDSNTAVGGTGSSAQANASSGSRPSGSTGNTALIPAALAIIAAFALAAAYVRAARR